MKKSVPVLAVLLLATQLFFGCRSTKPTHLISAATQQTEQALNICEQTIKYKVSKIKLINRQEERDVSMEIIIKPVEKLITINVASTQKGEGSTNTPIERLDCNFYDDLKDGFAIYQASVEGPRGEQKEVVYKFEVKEGDLTISYTEKGDKEEAIFKVDSWEVVKQ